MVYISYNIPDINRLLELAKTYSFIEIRQDLCNFTFNELEILLEAIEFPILTMKGNYKHGKSIIQYAIQKKSFLIDFDADWGKSRYDELISSNLKYSIKNHFIVSQHIDYYKFIKFSSFKLINDLLQWNSRFTKFIIENVDTEESYSKVRGILKLNNEKFAVFFTGKFGKESRIEAFKNNCPLNYAAYQDIRINDSQLSIGEYEKLV